jgi:hypothetical protein
MWQFLKLGKKPNKKGRKKTKGGNVKRGGKGEISATAEYSVDADGVVSEQGAREMYESTKPISSERLTTTDTAGVVHI